MKLGGTLQETISDEEILGRICTEWATATARGGRPGHDLYNAVCTATIKYFVRDGREGATIMVRKFVERNPYEFLEKVLAQHTEEAGSIAKEDTTDRASAAILAAQEDKHSQQRRLVFSTALLIALLALAQYIMEHTDKSLTWSDIPQTIQVTRMQAGVASNTATLLPNSKWLPIGYQATKQGTTQEWRSGLRTKNCQVSDFDDTPNVENRFREFAASKKIKLAGPVATSVSREMALQYPVTIYYASSAVDNSAHPEWKTYLSTAYSVFPEGLAAVGVHIGRLEDEEITPESALIQRLRSLVAGRAISCRQPTVWGWYFDRDRYLADF